MLSLKSGFALSTLDPNVGAESPQYSSPSASGMDKNSALPDSTPPPQCTLRAKMCSSCSPDGKRNRTGLPGSEFRSAFPNGESQLIQP